MGNFALGRRVDVGVVLGIHDLHADAGVRVDVDRYLHQGRLLRIAAAYRVDFGGFNRDEYWKFQIESGSKFVDADLADRKV